MCDDTRVQLAESCKRCNQLMFATGRARVFVAPYANGTRNRLMNGSGDDSSHKAVAAWVSDIFRAAFKLPVGVIGNTAVFGAAIIGPNPVPGAIGLNRVPAGKGWPSILRDGRLYFFIFKGRCLLYSIVFISSLQCRSSCFTCSHSC